MEMRKIDAFTGSAEVLQGAASMHPPLPVVRVLAEGADGTAARTPRRRPAAAGGIGLLSPRLVRSGYVPRNPALDAALNRGLALLFLILTAPIFAVVSLAILLTSGRPVFYAGARLGKNMREFNILKFRSLHPEAAAATRDSTLPTHTLLETRLGSYLRKSRLDELPQLWNILRGDMVFFGPRPVRRSLLALFEQEVPGFRIRFDVAPGLVGMSQALLPHSASKRLRGRFNAMCCRAPTNYPAMLGFVLLVGLSVVRRSVTGLFAAIAGAGSPLTRFNFLRSGFARPREATVEFTQDGESCIAGLVAMSDQVIQLALLLPIEPGEYRFRITSKLASGRRMRFDMAATVRSVCPVGPGRSGFIAYATYQPRTRFMQYRIQRYLLDDTVLPG